MFHTVETIPALASLQQNWRAILDELRALRSGDYSPWPERDLYDADDWKVFGLYAFGRRLDRNCGLCPRTTALVESIPGMLTAGFSRLEPGTEIKPHRGYAASAGYVLRCHLGLEIPSRCGIRVGGEVRHWMPGQCLLFDDSFEHEAWNKSGEARTVLLIDVRNPQRQTDQPAKWAVTDELADFLAAQVLLNQE